MEEQSLAKILVVCGREDRAELYGKHLHDRGELEVCREEDDAFDRLLSHRVDLLIVDDPLPKGGEWLQDARQIQQIEIVFLFASAADHHSLPWEVDLDTVEILPDNFPIEHLPFFIDKRWKEHNRHWYLEGRSHHYENLMNAIPDIVYKIDGEGMIL